MSNSGLGYTIFDPRATFLTYLTPTKVLSHKIDAVLGWTEADVREWVISVWGNQTDDWIDQLNDWLTGGVGAPGNIRIDPGNLLLEGSSPELRVGDGTGDPLAALNKGAANDAYIAWEDVGVERWHAWHFDSTEQLLAKRYDAGGVFQGDTITLTTAGNVLLEADLTLNSASPTFKEGTGTGGPTAELDAAVANGSNYRFRMAGLITWDLRNVATTKDWALRRYDAGGSALDNPAAFAFATGSATYTASASWSSPSPTLTIGDGTGDPVLVYNKADASQFISAWRVAGVNRWHERFNSTENLIWDAYDASGVLIMGSVMVLTNSNGTIQYGGSANYASATPVITVGNGTGSPTIDQNKSDAGASGYNFFVAGTRRWKLEFGSGEEQVWKRYDASGVFVDNPLNANVSTGNFVYSASATYSSASPTLTVGDGTGTPIVAINKEAAGVAYLLYRNVGVTRARVALDTSLNLLFQVADSGGATQATTTMAAATGAWTYPSNGTYSSASPTLTVGDGTGSPGIVLNCVATTGEDRIEFRVASVRRLAQYLTTGIQYEIRTYDGSGVIVTTTSLTNAGAWTYPGNSTWGSGSPQLTIGTGAGTPGILFNKGTGANPGTFAYRENSITLWLNRAPNGSNNWQMERHDAAGAFVDTPFLILFASGNITYSGSASYSSASPQVLIGDGTGNPNIRFLKSDAGAADINFGVVATNRATIRLDGNEDMVFLARDAGGSVTSTTTWANSGLWTYPSSSTWGSASPQLLIGDGTGNPNIRFLKSDAGAADINFGVVATNRATIRLDANEDVVFLARDTGGSVTSTTTWGNNGSWTYPSNGSYSSASPILKIGNDAGAPTLEFRKADTSAAGVNWFNGGVRRWKEEFTTAEDLNLNLYDSGGTIVGAAYGISQSTGSITYLASAFYGSASPVLQIGSNAGTPILRLYGTDTSKPALQFGDASDNDVAWLAYDHNNARFEWRVEATVKVYLDSVAFAPPSANWLNLGTSAFPFGILYVDALNPSVQVVVDTTANVGDMSIVTADDAGSTTPRDLDLPDPAPTGRVILIYVLRVPTGAGGFSLDPQTKNINGVAAKKLLASDGLYILSAVDASNWLLTGPTAFS